MSVQAGTLVPDAVWDTYPGSVAPSSADRLLLDSQEQHQERALIPGRPDAYACWFYCSNYYGGLVPSYFNLRLLSDRNECYCWYARMYISPVTSSPSHRFINFTNPVPPTHSGGECTLVEDPEYEVWTIQYPAPTTPPLPPLPNYETQSAGQRCAQQGTLQQTFVPPTQEQCWRLCSYVDGVAQPKTYFNLKTSVTPNECYCVVCVSRFDGFASKVR